MLTTFMAQNSANMSFTDRESNGKCPVCHNSCKGTNFFDLRVRNFQVFCILSILVLFLTFLAVILPSLASRSAWTCKKCLSATTTYNLNELSTNFPFPFIKVVTNMRPMSKEDKIFQSIVRPVSVDMMYIFTLSKRASKMFTHNESVFQDVSAFAGIKMVRFCYQYITRFCPRSTTTPSRIAFASLGMSMKITSIVSSFKAPDSRSGRYELFTTAAFALHNLSFQKITGISDDILYWYYLRNKRFLENVVH